VVPAGGAVRFPEWAGNNEEDAIFFNELAELGPVRAVPEPLMRYRKHPTSAQARTGYSSDRGCRNLLRWATEREPTRPGTLARLFDTLAELAVAARWKRNWPQYRALRAFCAANWPVDRPRPPVLTERVWPPAVYAAKDALDRLRGAAP
jgi:hypothetical protein